MYKTEALTNCATFLYYGRRIRTSGLRVMNPTRFLLRYPAIMEIFQELLIGLEPITC